MSAAERAGESGDDRASVTGVASTAPAAEPGSRAMAPEGSKEGNGDPFAAEPGPPTAVLAQSPPPPLVVADEDEDEDEDKDEDEDEADLTSGPEADGQGYIVLVGTPIGNLGDLSPRAVKALASADVIYCEDTRHSRKLLSHAGISGVRLRSLHEHNEEYRIDEVIDVVGRGRVAAVVSDAGMPGISDPGSRLVAAAALAGVTVTVVPGPSAVITALVSSGLATDRFCFEGFLPRSGRERRQRLEQVAKEPRTSVMFEAPTRVAATLAHLAESCGGARLVSVARELTKLHEEVWRGTLADGAEWASSGMIRGEVVLVLEGAPPVDQEVVGDEQLRQAMEARLAGGERTRGVVDDVAAAFQVPRRRVYELALVLKGTDPAPAE
jgi:16S rRNA (cytidine1402-2'-O)-methyltransferase